MMKAKTEQPKVVPKMMMLEKTVISKSPYLRETVSNINKSN
jgi:hypothetical protein